MTTQTPTAATTELREGFYVSVWNGRDKRGMLLGPYSTHDEALANVDVGRREARAVNDRAVWYFYGTAKVTAKRLPVGSLNTRLGLYPDFDTMKEPA